MTHYSERLSPQQIERCLLKELHCRCLERLLTLVREVTSILLLYAFKHGKHSSDNTGVLVSPRSAWIDKLIARMAIRKLNNWQLTGFAFMENAGEGEETRGKPFFVTGWRPQQHRPTKFARFICMPVYRIQGPLFGTPHMPRCRGQLTQIGTKRCIWNLLWTI